MKNKTLVLPFMLLVFLPYSCGGEENSAEEKVKKMEAHKEKLKKKEAELDEALEELNDL